MWYASRELRTESFKVTTGLLCVKWIIFDLVLKRVMEITGKTRFVEVN